MAKARIIAHVRQALSWSAAHEAGAGAALAAALGMAVPVALGLWAGRPAEGFAAALGALGVAQAEPGDGIAASLRHAAGGLAATLGAFLVVVAAGGLGPWRDLAVIAVAAGAALAGSFSRPLARGTTQFVIFLTIALAVPLSGARQAIAVLGLVLAGALFASALTLAGASVTRRPPPRPETGQPHRAPTARQKFARWKRTLATLDGWSYTLRLTAGLAVASLADASWPGHHMHWIGLTVALLTPREAEWLSVRTTQRAVGTAIGVAGTGLLFRAGLPGPALVLAVAAMAGLRAWLRPRNYLAYSIVMTPLIILIIDGGRPPTGGLLGDRLLATAVGAALVVALSAAMLALRAGTPPPGGPPRKT